MLARKLGFKRASILTSVINISRIVNSILLKASRSGKGKKRILFLVSHNPDRHGYSSLFRGKAYFTHLSHIGFHCRLAHAIPRTDLDKVIGVDFLRRRSKRLFELWRSFLIRVLILKRAWDVGQAGLYDAVYLLRELIPDLIHEPWMETLLQQINPNLVFDFDDALYAPPSWYPVEEAWRGERTRTLLSLAKQVIVGNETLKEFALTVNPNVTLIPTCVDLKMYPLKRDYHGNGKVVLGWLGSWPNLFYLKQIKYALQQLAQRRKFILRIVSDKPQDPSLLEYPNVEVDFRKWRLRTALHEVSKFDVGLMPLTNDPWAAGKCGFKIIQYMACGVPVVASAVGINCELVKDNVNGYLARSMPDWVERLTLLIDNPQLRAAMGREGRAFVEKNYDIRLFVERFGEVLRRAYS